VPCWAICAVNVTGVVLHAVVPIKPAGGTTDTIGLEPPKFVFSEILIGEENAEEVQFGVEPHKLPFTTITPGSAQANGTIVIDRVVVPNSPVFPVVKSFQPAGRFQS